MKRSGKILLAAGIILCAAGAGLGVAGWMTGGKTYIAKADLNSMDAAAVRDDHYKAMTMDKTKLEDIREVQIHLKDIDLEIQPSEDENYYLSYQLENDYASDPIEYEVTDGVLKLDENIKEKLYFVHIDLDFIEYLSGGHDLDDYEDRVTLYVPKGQTLAGGSIKIDDGDMTAREVSWQKVELQLASGDLSLRDTAIADSEITVFDGDIVADNLTVTGEVTMLDRDGDVMLTLNPETMEQLTMILDTMDGEIYHSGSITGDMYREGEDKIHFERQGSENGGKLTVKANDGDIMVKLKQDY